MNGLAAQFLFLAFLVVVNAAFVLSETSILSARKALLQQRADGGDPGARAALSLAASPNHFLATLQIGITLVAILAGAYGGATFADALAERLRRVPLLQPYSKGLSIALVVASVTYVNLIFGELVPKRLALHRSERIASRVSGLVHLLSVVASPLIKLLSYSTDLILRLFGVRAHRETPVTEEEIKVLIDQGTQAGVFEEAEQDMVERVFRLSDRRVSSLMTPRTDISWVDLHEETDDLRRRISGSSYSRLPVAEGSLDEVVGLVNVKDLLAQVLSDGPLDVRGALVPPLFVPEAMRALTLMDHFKQTGNHVALVIDEFGGIQGLVTFTDVLQALVGEISPFHEETPQASQRDDGSWLVDGLLSVDEFENLLRTGLPGENRDDYQTVGGFVVMRIGHIPTPAEHFRWGGLRFEVLDMDGNRVDKILVSREAAC